ncbi:MAG: UMP kinase [Candidatus Brocadia sp. AMX2]|uniref:Uridylate kinase n=1 Tax=Candidatus Brocadia sinica JPN1 TaxID=1197129 RepID=A0ABQ0JXN8_9BACT|nr:MAG: UMP kinase [Candidatus Brocadia sp. AMX2]KXK29420.1 MAG: uridylate kinase [Candidatus Brocadia sinica]MBC6933792.1 UMP kinase [Candidatus Brocadia sp.]MBL1170527.1 UMP kinase [Candidatus Brocadia sp. AMX1]NOG40745.1 UMP kinase [Planctomycetota bacterium]GAN33450.1 uridylate kinase [Candidatus Brocadia sinica JPN1]
MKSAIKYKRVLLKLSGEGFGDEGGRGLESERFDTLAKEIQKISRTGVELAIVVGGGNILRGAKLSNTGKSRVQADQIGMIATAINALFLQDTLEGLSVETRVVSALEIKNITEPFVLRNCLQYLKEKNVVIFAGGTGNPYFTTDTAAALRAIEIKADIMLKATQVDGVYSDDPRKNVSAKLYKKLTYMDVLSEQLGVMDLTAISLSMENKLPIIVLNINNCKNIEKAISGKPVGTYIGE